MGLRTVGSAPGSLPDMNMWVRERARGIENPANTVGVVFLKGTLRRNVSAMTNSSIGIICR